MKVKYTWIIVSAGIGLIILIGALVTRQRDTNDLLAGWQIIKPPNEISVLMMHQGQLWVGGRDGVFCMDIETGEIIRELISDIPFKYVRGLICDQQNKIWIGHQSGVSCYNGSNFRHFTKSQGLPDNRINCMIQDHSGRIWVGTFAGAACFQNGNWQIYTEADGLLTKMVNVMFEDHNRGIWFGSYVAPKGGISILKSNGTWQYITPQNGLHHANVNAILQDHFEGVWVGTGFLNRGGAAYLVSDQHNQWHVTKLIGKQEGLAGSKVRSLFMDSHQAMWFGFESEGVTHYREEKLKSYTVRNGLSDNEVKVMLQDSIGRLWLGTFNGLTRIDTSALTTLYQGLEAKK